MGRNCSKEGKNRGKVKNSLCEVFDLLCRHSIIECSGVCFVWLQGNLSDKFTRKINSKNLLGKTWRKREAKKSVENADVFAPARSTRTLAHPRAHPNSNFVFLLSQVSHKERKSGEKDGENQ